MAHALSGAVRRCGRCGCTHDDPCFALTAGVARGPLLLPDPYQDERVGIPCAWVGPALCSACATAVELLAVPEGLAWLAGCLAIAAQPLIVARPCAVLDPSADGVVG